QKAAGLAGNGSEGRIHRDANDVVSWWYNRLPIATVKNKKLPAQEEPVSVCPSMADALVPGNSHAAGIPELRAPGRLSSVSGRHGIGIQHAKALLGRLPDEPCIGIDQLVQGVMAEMVVVVAGGKLEQAIVVGNVNVWIAHDDIRIADIG